ncbi:MAG: hypothetical protein ABEH59_12420 [Halobacteriales archaeon]
MNVYSEHHPHTRIPEELAEAIEAISEEEQLDKSAVARRLLQQAVDERQRKRAFERYEAGDISLERLAREAGLALRQAVMELRERDVSFRYSAQSLAEDRPDT